MTDPQFEFTAIYDYEGMSFAHTIGLLLIFHFPSEYQKMGSPFVSYFDICPIYRRLIIGNVLEGGRTLLGGFLSIRLTCGCGCGGRSLECTMTTGFVAGSKVSKKVNRFDSSCYRDHLPVVAYNQSKGQDGEISQSLSSYPTTHAKILEGVYITSWSRVIWPETNATRFLTW